MTLQRFALAFLTLCSSLPAQLGTWTGSVATGPALTLGARLVFDTARNVCVAVGSTGLDGGHQTWEFDGAAWTQVSSISSLPGGGPSVGQEALAGLYFDTAVQRVRAVTSRDGATTVVWEFDGVAAWATVPAASAPSGRDRTGCSYDQVRGVLVLFGGEAGGSLLADTWEFSAGTWAQVAANGPAPRAGQAQAYDVASQQTFVNGGVASGSPSNHWDTWSWDGTQWTDEMLFGPNPRSGANVTYDSANQGVLLFGGDFWTDTWFWNGARWENLFPPSAPPAHGPIAYDPVRNVTVALLPDGQTWELDVVQLVLGSFTFLGGACPGSNGLPTMNPAGIPTIDNVMGVALGNLPFVPASAAWGLLGRANVTQPLDLAGIGAPGCVLHSVLDFVTPIFSSGGSGAWFFLIPDQQSLVGQEFEVQGLAFDLDINPLDAVTTNALRLRIGNY